MSNKEKEVKQRRKNFGLWIGSVLILIVIVVTFVGGPLLAQAAPTQTLSFGKYKNVSIDLELDSYFYNQVQQVSQQYDSSSSDQYQEYQVFREAFENTVVHEAILKTAEEKGLYVSKKLIDSTIVKEGPYREDGKFSQKLYENTPESERLATREKITDYLIENQYRTYVFANALSSSKEEEFLKDMGKEEVMLDFILLEADMFPQDRILSFGESNSSLFDKISLSKITVENNAEAQEIAQKLKEDPASFDFLAENESIDALAENGGQIGYMYRHALQQLHSEDILNTIFNMKQGEISPVIEAGENWIIYQCDVPAIAADFASEADLTELKNYFNTYEKDQVDDYLIAKANVIRDLSLEGNFKETAENEGVTVYSTNFFPINYGSNFLYKNITAPEKGDTFNEFVDDKVLLTELFSLDLGEISEPTPLDNGIVMYTPTATQTVEPVEGEYSIFDYWEIVLEQYVSEAYKNSVLNSEDFQDDFFDAFMKLY